MSRARRKVRTGRLGTDGADGVVAPGNPSVIPGQTKRGQRLVLRQNLARRLVVERSVLIRPLIPRDSLGHSSFRTTSVRTAAWSLAEAQRRPASRALPANMRETVTPLKFSVEGEQGSEVDERIGAGDRGGSEGNAAAVHG